MDAFVFREVLDGAFLPDDTTEDCDADVVDNAEEGGTGDNVPVVDAIEAVNADVVDEEGLTVTITSVMFVVVISTGGSIVTNVHLVRAGRPTGGSALAAAFVFLRVRGAISELDRSEERQVR